ncbi:hypothetical protein RB195_025158 [Necator americanus]|uniref:Uncharacterized protein n=1 Tax=Necator americanus TaxID=51031 RepID=A0ABR1ER39_NECAM
MRPDLTQKRVENGSNNGHPERFRWCHTRRELITSTHRKIGRPVNLVTPLEIGVHDTDPRISPYSSDPVSGRREENEDGNEQNHQIIANKNYGEIQPPSVPFSELHRANGGGDLHKKRETHSGKMVSLPPHVSCSDRTELRADDASDSDDMYVKQRSHSDLDEPDI